MSKLFRHAKCELAIAKAHDTLYGDLLPRSVLELVETFSRQGHSGMSASLVLELFQKVARFEPLTPLTGEDSEWENVGNGLFQNRRCSRVFKENGQAYDIEGRVFREANGVTTLRLESRVPVVFPYVPKHEYVDA